MNPELADLIEAFGQETAAAVALFLQRASLDHPFSWQERGMLSSGVLPGNPPIHYRFHGRGLYLEIGKRSLDFDLGFDGRTGGFNHWWLWLYAEERPERFGTLLQGDRLKRELDAARSNGWIGPVHARQQDDLDYRLAAGR